MKSTIFALASGAGRCGVSIVRVSGPRCPFVYKHLTRGGASPIARNLHPVRLYDPRDNGLLDAAMAVVFAGPKSLTGEDVLELHLHGSASVVSAVYRVLSDIDGVRMARPGEFTERAFRAGKMDLRQVEGLGDLLAADTALQRTQALDQLIHGDNGALIVRGWREKLIDGLARTEAFIDFSEDENIENETLDRVKDTVTSVCREMSDELARTVGERIRDGFKVVISGPPNVGKSSLFNEMVGRNAAIVSPAPGTTRDVLQANLDIKGVPVVLHDTAGIRDDAADEIEAEGVRRATEALQSADLVIQLDSYPVPSPLLWHEKVLRVVNKCDIGCAARVDGHLAISCKTREGMDRLVDKIYDTLMRTIESREQNSTPVITRARHRQHLAACAGHLNRFLCEADIVLAAEHLRHAVHECGIVGGHVHTEDVLDTLFKSFCIGK